MNDKMTTQYPIFVNCKDGKLSYDCNPELGCWHTFGWNARKEPLTQTGALGIISAEYWREEHKKKENEKAQT